MADSANLWTDFFTAAGAPPQPLEVFDASLLLGEPGDELGPGTGVIDTANWSGRDHNMWSL